MNFASTTITSFLSNIDLNNPTWDLLIIAIFLMGSFVYGFSLGRGRTLSLLIAAYISLALVKTLPISGIVSQWLPVERSNEAVGFLIVFVLLFFIISRSRLIAPVLHEDHTPWWQAILFAILHIGLILSITLSLLPAYLLDNFSTPIRNLFTSTQATYIWLLAPIVLMAIFRRRHALHHRRRFPF